MNDSAFRVTKNDKKITYEVGIISSPGYCTKTFVS